LANVDFVMTLTEHIYSQMLKLDSTHNLSLKLVRL